MIKESGKAAVGNFFGGPDNAELNEGDEINFQTRPFAEPGRDPFTSYMTTISNNSTIVTLLVELDI